MVLTGIECKSNAAREAQWRNSVCTENQIRALLTSFQLTFDGDLTYKKRSVALHQMTD